MSSKLNLKAAYENITQKLKKDLPHDGAMEKTVGGKFDIVGPIEVDIVRRLGLSKEGYLIDVGCGSGRLAKPLSKDHAGKYLGIDLVAELLDYARKITNRSDWKFQEIDHINIPEEDGTADMVCFFSVMTHLLHEQTYWYLEEAARVLKPGGKVVFSFLEYSEPAHYEMFKKSVALEQSGEDHVLIVFNDRDAIQRWAIDLGFTVDGFFDSSEKISESGALGQSVCALSKK